MITQGSPEWYAARLGKVTASRVVDMMARTKTGWGASRANYEAQLIAERMTGEVANGYQSAEMLRGKEVEPEARAAYEFFHSADIEQVGFIDHPIFEMCGASPDGLIGSDGLVEFKCPNTATHLSFLTGKSIDGKYLKQMQFQMAVTQRSWCDFCSYDPRLPAALRLHVIRVERDQTMIDQIEAITFEFLTGIEAKIADLRSRFEPDLDLNQHPMMAG